MPAVIIEKFDSGAATIGPDSPNVDLHYSVVGTENDLDVRAIVESTIPAIIRGMIFQNYHIDHLGGGVWDVSVRYGQLDNKAPDAAPPGGGGGGGPAGPGDELGFSFTIDTTGGTQHITQSIQTIASYAKPGKMAPDLKGAIGFNGDSVEGCDITVPVYKFSMTYAIAAAAMTFGYAKTLMNLTGKVNNAKFKNFEAGEVLFLGASGNRRDLGAWEVTYQFAASPNALNLQVGDIVGINKKGWEYLWVRYSDVEDANVLVKQPESVHIEKVYELANFALLGIGA